MENEQNRVEVEIYGVRYTLKGDAPPETMVGMSRDVDEKMRVVLQRNPKLSLYKAAILTALNLAEELHMLREEYDNLVKMLEPQRKKKNK
ncbi:MAG: cell division protein ZapA [Firmicutes bacterium]|nr:cell division protein ZapA [Bacillota bacterium]